MNPGGTTCTITSVDGCFLISGNVEVTLLNTLIASLPKRAVFNFEVQRLGGYSFAMGPADALKAIAKRLGDAEVRALAASHPGLSDAARRWLAYGPLGSSSAAMFWACTGVTPRNTKVDPDALAHPRDPEDLLRCLRLLDMVPECADAPEAMRGRSEVWTRLADAWPTLVESMDAEVPDWRFGRRGRAQKTHDLMQRAIGGAP